MILSKQLSVVRSEYEKARRPCVGIAIQEYKEQLPIYYRQARASIFCLRKLVAIICIQYMGDFL